LHVDVPCSASKPKFSFLLAYVIKILLSEWNAFSLSSSVVKTQKVAVNVHALPESRSLCKLIDYVVMIPLKTFVLILIFYAVP